MATTARSTAARAWAVDDAPASWSENVTARPDAVVV